MGDHYDEFREAEYAMRNNTTSPGLADLLRRHGYTPTGKSDEDLKTARRFMPKPWKQVRFGANWSNLLSR